MKRANVRLGAAVVVALGVLVGARVAFHANKGPTTSAPSAPMRWDLVWGGARIEGMSTGTDSAFAVGDDGVILRRRGSDPAWRAMTAPSRSTLRAVAQRLDEAVAVGDDGTILELRGESWVVAAPVTKRTLRAVAYSSYGVIAVGDGGTIVVRSAPGEPWRAEPSGTRADLFGVCAGLRDVWVVGSGGAIVMHAPFPALGDAWRVHPSVGAATLRAVACDDEAAIAVGDHGTLLDRRGDVDWHDGSSGTTRDLFAVAAPLGTRSWLAVGAGGVTVRAAGTPVVRPSSVDWSFRAVIDGPLGSFVGGDGGIVRAAR